MPTAPLWSQSCVRIWEALRDLGPLSFRLLPLLAAGFGVCSQTAPPSHFKVVLGPSLASDHEPRLSSPVMSPPPNTYSSSLTTPTTVESSTSQDISSSRKSPPPPKLNLDECKHIFSTTTTNTSTNAAVNPSTAFVFTSSRTLPNLYNCSHSTDEVHPHNSSASSPGSLNSSISPGSQPCTPKRPVLSPAQLARHSMGAVDARCIVSPNMRAAGFVPLHHSSPYQPSSLSGPSTSILSPVPTPVDPPRFPPIVFCNPANVTTTPLWDYQRKLQYGLPSGKSAVSASAPVETKSVLARPSIHPLPTTQSKANKITASNSTSYSSMFSNVPSSRSSMTSISSLNVQSPDDDTNSSQYASVRENLADGYPFPATPPRSRTHSHETDPFSTTRKGPLPVAALSSVASSTASVTPLAPLSPTTSVASLPHSTFGSAKGSATSSSASGPLLPAPSQAYARPVPRSSRTGDASSLSMTELYQISPRAWPAGSMILPQLTLYQLPVGRQAVVGVGRSRPGGRVGVLLRHGAKERRQLRWCPRRDQVQFRR